MIEIPLGLRRALETGECVLFLGAGIGHNLRDPSGRTAPTAAILANEIADHFSIDTSPQNKADLAKISSIIEIRIGRPELESFLRSRLSNLRPDDNLLWLFSLRWRAIFTTNYDYSIRYAYDLLSNPKQQPIVITQTSEITKYDPRFQVPIYHLHGTLFGPSQPHIVITENDYSIFREQRKMLFELLKYEFATSTILYIGYSHQDSNWRLVLNELYSEFASSQQPRSYRIAPATDALDLEILTARNIETLECTYDDFYLSASVLLSPEDVDVHRLQQERSKIPSDFISEFDRNPASVTRLFSSWTYVNQAPFNEVSNIYDFIRGDKPNWGLVGARHIFERDIESQIYDEVIDNITNQDNKVYINLILAPACYGITTLLMTVASRLVKDRVGAVFFLNSEQSILEGDVEYINSLFSENIILFVDNAAEQGEALNLVVSRLQNSGKRAVFILGERLNEWRQARTRIYGKEFTLDPLSDAEIDRLLDYLSNQGELNTLTPLSRDLQHSIIKQKHGKELVVVMRETTEGKSFDAILENEFRGIKDPLSRKLYLFVCCFYQHGAYIRDSLLSRLLGVSNTELYDLTDEATEGVVIYDCIDKARDTFGARARHRVIAAVVWERCGDASEKEQILQGALNNLNLNYQSDKDAFDRFVRSDRIVDSIRSLEGKTRFFDRASDKDPLSPYVKQHYARMLWRNDRPNLALAQINSAIDLNPRVRVLHHTKGIILAGLAIGSESNEVARRYLVQSEKAFNHCLSM
ncbi:MAG: hypothetical protein BroJett018_35430 [Chloroflexota bacterium]|nr:SIR2 family protein [Chloroflexota bacterium]NOG63948.1 SIR2 family protein [Chloroflexota bacterium]GIK65749.1 MAG: hypothetical protein BroJett018_35430 [Chloroflexota bacterium]